VKKKRSIWKKLLKEPEHLHHISFPRLCFLHSRNFTRPWKIYVNYGRQCASTCWPGWLTEMASDVIGGKARGFPQKYHILAGSLNRRKATNRNLKEMLYTERNNRKEGRFFSLTFPHVSIQRICAKHFWFSRQCLTRSLSLSGRFSMPCGRRMLRHSEQPTTSDFRMIYSRWGGCWNSRLMCVVDTFIGRPVCLKPLNFKGCFASCSVTYLHLWHTCLQNGCYFLVKALAYPSPIPQIAYIASNFL